MTIRKWMRWSLLCVVLWPSAALAQTVPTFTVGTALTAEWQPPLDVTEEQSATNRYEVNLDTDAAWTVATTQMGQPLYRWSIPQNRLTVGTHTIRVRGCNNDGCGGVMFTDFAIRRPLPGQPRPGPGGGVVPTSPQATLTIPQAVNLANAYAYLTLEPPRYLTAEELSGLAARHPVTPPTKASVLALLDAVYAELAR